jgi:hypothetical protein
MARAQKKESERSIETQRAQMQTGFVNERLFRRVACERDDLEVVWSGAMCQPDSVTRDELLPRYSRGELSRISPSHVARRRHTGDE